MFETQFKLAVRTGFSTKLVKRCIKWLKESNKRFKKFCKKLFHIAVMDISAIYIVGGIGLSTARG